jgi:hypothetical protein
MALPVGATAGKIPDANSAADVSQLQRAINLPPMTLFTDFFMAVYCRPCQPKLMLLIAILDSMPDGSQVAGSL